MSILTDKHNIKKQIATYRNLLKSDVLYIRAEALKKKIDTYICEVENMTQEYTELVEKINSLCDTKESNNSCYTKPTHPCVVSAEKTFDTYDDYGEDTKQVLPDVGDNSEIWDRMARAHNDAMR